MPELAAKLSQLGRDQAYGRTTFGQVNSWLGTQLHTLSKPTSLATVGTTVVTSFLPPGIGALVDWSEGKLAAGLQEHMRNRRANLAADDYGRMKFKIKTLDINHLDTARHKVKKCVDALEKASEALLDRRNPCQRAYEFAYRYYRLENRLTKLASEAAMLKELGEEILAWVDGIEHYLDENRMKQYVEVTLAGGNHGTCNSKACFYGGKPIDSDEAPMIPKAPGQLGQPRGPGQRSLPNPFSHARRQGFQKLAEPARIDDEW